MPTCKTLSQALLCALYAILFASSLEGGGLMRNLAIRGTMLGGSSAAVPTAADYVQDGLVAMWDGIENAGWGQHASSLSSWKNLIMSTIGDMDLAGEYEVEDDAIRMNRSVTGMKSGTGIGTANCIIQGTERTIEYCISDFVPNINSSRTSRYSAFLLLPNTFPCVYVSDVSINNRDVNYVCGLYSQQYDSGLWYFNGWANTPPGFNPILNYGDVFSSSVVLGSDNRGYVNGIFQNSSRRDYGRVSNFSGTLQFFNRTSDYSRPLNGNVHNFRIYNRALTAEEVAANYSVDKARFGIA